MHARKGVHDFHRAEGTVTQAWLLLATHFMCNLWTWHSSPLHHPKFGMERDGLMQNYCFVLLSDDEKWIIQTMHDSQNRFLDIFCGDMQSCSDRTCSSISCLSSSSAHTAYTACSAWGRVCDAAPASPGHLQLQQRPQELRSDCTT